MLKYDVVISKVPDSPLMKLANIEILMSLLQSNENPGGIPPHLAWDIILDNSGLPWAEELSRRVKDFQKQAGLPAQGG